MTVSYGTGKDRIRSFSQQQMCNAFVVEGYSCLSTLRVVNGLLASSHADASNFKRVRRSYTKCESCGLIPDLRRKCTNERMPKYAGMREISNCADKYR